MPIVLIILICILAAALLLILAAAINAARIKAKPAKNAPSPVACTKEEISVYGSELARLIKVPTVSRRGETDPAAFEQLHEVMRSEFPNVFRVMDVYETEGNLLLTWKGKTGERSILLMGHQDVVPAPAEGWSHPPFSGELEDGKVFGRGTLDSKCTIYSEFKAVEELIKEGFEPQCDIYLSASVDEEISGPGAPALVRELMRRGVKLELVIDECGPILEEDALFPGLDRPFAVLGVMEKGYADVKITALSHGGHSSTPPSGTPLARLAGFVNEVERKRPFERKFSPAVELMLKRLAPSLNFPLRMLFGNLWLFKPLVRVLFPAISAYGAALLSTTCAFTMCSGSDAANVIPSAAYVVANIRTSAHQSVEESVAVLKGIAKKYDLQFEILEAREASPSVDTDGAIYGFVEGCIAECFPDVGISPYLIMGGTDCRHYAPLTENGIRCCPIRMSKAQVESCHAIDENITVSALGENMKFFKHVLRRWDSAAV